MEPKTRNWAGMPIPFLALTCHYGDVEASERGFCRVDEGPTFRAIWAARTALELDQIAHVKRFVERLCADAQFRSALSGGADPNAVCETRGIGVDATALRPMYDPRMSEIGPDDVSDTLRLWWDYEDDIHKFVADCRLLGDPQSHCPTFAQWRQRQIRRVDSECGRTGKAIVHPLVAFELSDGCSVGCWFCGVSATKLTAVWPYSPSNASMWRGILETLVAEFGPAAGTGFLYWATEPLDNPDYPRFVRDFIAITGRQPQTTTAVALRAPQLTAEVMRIFEEHQHVANRFSVLTVAALDGIHARWAPRELLGVELVPQLPGSIAPKARAGRNLRRTQRTAAEADRQGTIACVTGLLVNMLRGEVLLISPTIATQRWPDGYKVWGRRSFGSVRSFADALRSLIADEVEDTPSGSTQARFRADLRIELDADGFDIYSASCCHELRGGHMTRTIGSQIASNTQTYASLRRDMRGAGVDPLVLEAVLAELFDAGYLAEQVDLRDSHDSSAESRIPVMVGSRH